ncbi:MAG: IclR family transcriptional regulator [Sphingomonadales bacterium]|nr:MAG: IclR family transcriptional regulator [Sphingomonadales bacterium]
MFVKQAANVLEILEFFSRRLHPATPAEIADELGWPRSSTFNIVGTLAARGFLYEPQLRGGYYPSPRWLALAEIISRAEPLPEEIQRLLHDVAAETGETTLISAAAGTHAIFVLVEESFQPVRYFARAGDRVPIHASSAGRALLEQMSLAARHKLYLKMDFQTYSAATPANADAVETELAAAFARGYHQSHAEYTPDLAGVSVALPNQPRLFSITVVGPVSRCLERRCELAAILRQQVAKLPG